MAAVIRSSDEKIYALTTSGGSARICSELLRLASPDKSNIDLWHIIPIPTQEQIAKSAGVTRRTVSRLFSKLYEDNIMERTSEMLIILKREMLEAVALQSADDVIQ